MRRHYLLKDRLIVEERQCRRRPRKERMIFMPLVELLPLALLTKMSSSFVSEPVTDCLSVGRAKGHDSAKTLRLAVLFRKFTHEGRSYYSLVRHAIECPLKRDQGLCNQDELYVELNREGSQKAKNS